MPEILQTIPHLINTFFLYSFFGWCMEMVVIRHEKGRFENRGFAKSPFCIIYGFGAMIGYTLLKPFSFSYVVLFFVGALAATIFEYFTAQLMIRLFGGFWWDYTNKPLNYKGILCLESTLGWGLITVLLFAFMHDTVTNITAAIPQNIASVLAFTLTIIYIIDFSIAFKKALEKRKNNTMYKSTEVKE